MPSIFNHNDTTVTVKYIRKLCEDVLRKLEDYSDDTEIETKSNTYGISVPYLSTTSGFIPLRDIEYRIADEEDVNESKKLSKRILKESKYGRDVIDDLIEVAQENIDNGTEVTEAIADAISEHLIYSEDIIALLSYYNSINGQKIIDSYYDRLADDISKGIELKDDDKDTVTCKKCGEEISIDDAIRWEGGPVHTYLCKDCYAEENDYYEEEVNESNKGISISEFAKNYELTDAQAELLRKELNVDSVDSILDEDSIIDAMNSLEDDFDTCEWYNAEDNDYPLNDSKKPIKFSALKKHLKESKSPYREILEYAEIAVEDLNRMGEEGFDDENLRRVARGVKTPYYDDIVEKIISDYNSDLSPETIELLSEYRDGNKTSAFTVRSHILTAIETFVNSFSI